MPLTEIVVDTNIFLHAHNNQCAWYQSSNVFLTALNEASIFLVVDLGAPDKSGQYNSKIIHEYQKIMPGSIGYSILTNLFQNSRVKYVTEKVPRQFKKYIEKLIPNKRDRTFVFVTYNSNDHILISHDFDDFHEGLRDLFKENYNLTVCATSEATEFF